MDKKKNLIVFDIDGTLTDSVRIHQDAFVKSLNLIGVNEFNIKFSTYKHHTDSHIAKVIYESSTNNKFDKEKQNSFENHLFELISEQDIIEISGAKNIIENIENNTDFGICYATGSLYRPAKYKLEQIGIKHIQRLLVASDEIEEREKIIEKAIENSLKHYNVEKFERIISVGDGIWDLVSAESLNIEFIGIGKINYETMIQKGMIRHYNDLTKIKINEI